MIPSTPAELYDELHTLFGVGTYDENNGQPWYQHRMTEIAKLRAMLKRRGCTVAEVHAAAAYAQSHDVPVKDAWQVFVLVPEANAYYASRERERQREAIREELDEAAIEALSEDDEEWAQRLARTPPEHAARVLDQWRNR